MKFLFVSCFLLIGSLMNLFAQNPTQTIRGQVIDREAKIPLIGATVVILNTQPILGNVTDVEGNFKIENVPVGRHTLRISYIGYEDALISEILVGAGKEVVLNIPLIESLQLMEEVVITAEEQKGTPNNEMTTVSARSFSVEETKRYAASINDPARMASSFAGVATSRPEAYSGDSRASRFPIPITFHKKVLRAVL
jgi:CarboxypepD_reg-like domain